MAKIFKVPFVQNANFIPVKNSTANTNTNGSGTLSSAFVTGAAEGTRVSRVRFQATGTVTNGRLIIVYDNAMPIGSILVTATTPSATVLPWEGEIVFSEPIVIPSGKTLKFATYNAEEFCAIPFAADY